MEAQTHTNSVSYVAEAPALIQLRQKWGTLLERSRPKIAAGPTEAFHCDRIKNLWPIVPTAKESKAVT